MVKKMNTISQTWAGMQNRVQPPQLIGDTARVLVGR
jgi:hypothetical protein